MKSQKLFLEAEEPPSLPIGLIRLAIPTPDYELFYSINLINRTSFQRTEDLIIDGEYYAHHFAQFTACNQLYESTVRCFSNKPVIITNKKAQDQLFPDEKEHRLLLPSYPDVDYIITSSDISPDFSLILLPDSLAFAIEHYTLGPEEELHQILQYHE